MMRVLVWKELREQWVSAATVVLLAAFLLVCAPKLGGVPYDTDGVLIVCISWVCGLAAGVQPLASEYESGTLNWLDSLPPTRRRLWWAKAGSAAAVVLLQVAILYVIGRQFVPVPQISLLGDPLFSLAFALAGLSCGFLGSTLARTALTAFGLAIAVEVVMVAASVLFVLPLRGQPTMPDFIVVVGLCVPLAVSARLFCQLDRQRRSAAASEQSTSGRGWRSLLWLAWMQTRLVWWLVLLGGLLGVVLVPSVVPHLWPAFGLALGLVLGIVSFGADQAGGSYQFLGVRRVPPGRFWLVKTGVCASAMIVVIVADFLYGYARETTLKNGDPYGDPWRFLQLRQCYDASLVLLGPVCGFAIGQFFGLICRRGLMAIVLAVFVGGSAVAVWMPSLIFGGVHLWQWLLPPILLTVAARLAVWLWASARLATLKPVLGLAATVIVCVAAVAGGIAYRVAEVPVKSDPFDVAAFEATFPTPDQNRAGRAIALALRHFSEHTAAGNLLQQPAHADGERLYVTRVQRAVGAADWPADPELDLWLDAMFEGDWLNELRAAVRLPYGMISQSGQVNQTVGYQTANAAETAGQLLLARAFQRTARGHAEEAFEDIALVLRLCGHLKNKANSPQFAGAAILESKLASSLPKWGSKTAVQPDLLHRAIDVLRNYETDLPPLSDAIKIDYVQALDHPPTPAGFLRDYSEVEAELRHIAANAPWEQARSRAVVATWYSGLLRSAEATYPDALRRIAAAGLDWHQPVNYPALAWMPPPGDDATARRTSRQMVSLFSTSIWLFGMPSGSYVFHHESRACVDRRAAQVQLALMLYETQHGRAAVSLNQLVPEFLTVLPADPFGSGPFGYRVSPGEMVQWDRANTDTAVYHRVAAGQGILWSVGPDLQDDGGRVNEQVFWNVTNLTAGADILFLVPTVSKP